MNPKKNHKRLNELRIIGGHLKGSKISFLDQAGLRPTGSRVRETLFNWLDPVIRGSRCLDLFSGSGALAFEAISRGAAEVTAIELSKQSSLCLNENAIRLKTDNLQIVEGDALAWVAKYNSDPFDIIFIDPPYDSPLLNQVIQLIQNSALLHNNTVLYLEHESQSDLGELPDNWKISRQKQAGNVSYYLLHSLISPDE